MAGCPKCGNVDIQVLELLQAWNEIERLEGLLKEKDKPAVALGFAVPSLPFIQEPPKPEPVVVQILNADEQKWKERYDKIKEAYVKTRLDVSGSFGNWSGDTRRRVLEHEISEELGFLI